MIKIDFQETYDSVEWPYLKQVMKELGFPKLFISWVMECIQTINYTVIVNGEYPVPFNAAKGLREGDLMSPFLFAIVMEYLSRSLHDLNANKEYIYHPDVQSSRLITYALLMTF
ncbi:secreted RxLR effector protein 78-like [Nicotiana tomentosiformis]|uniref:secreted RxLR effector protein 78-like n=1 Tax=Nicotiana tomentosiformis TaxID=4098 RepID=UPI00388C9BE4